MNIGYFTVGLNIVKEILTILKAALTSNFLANVASKVKKLRNNWLFCYIFWHLQ